MAIAGNYTNVEIFNALKMFKSRFLLNCIIIDYKTIWNSRRLLILISSDTYRELYIFYPLVNLSLNNRWSIFVAISITRRCRIVLFKRNQICSLSIIRTLLIWCYEFFSLGDKL